MNNADLTTILLDIHQNRLSGVLRVEKKTEKKQLVIKAGWLAFAESSVADDHLVKIMARQKFIQEANIRRIAGLMKEGKTVEDAIMEIQKKLTLAALEKGREDQATSILASLWGWGDFSMKFYTGENLIHSRINLKQALPDAIISSARHAVSVRFFSTPRNFIEGFFSTVGKFKQAAEMLPLNVAESAILSMLENPMNTPELLEKVALRFQKPSDSVLALTAIGLICCQQRVEQMSQDSVNDGSVSMLQVLNSMILRLKKADYYETLSITKSATAVEIQEAYHKLARQFHPDRFQSKEFTKEDHQKAQRVFSAVNEAYFTLKSPDTRVAYNAYLVESAAGKAGPKQENEEQEAALFFQNSRTLIAKGEYTQAVEQLKRCVWMRPENVEYQYYLGVAASKVPALRKDAEQQFLKVIELDSTFVEAYMELAKLYISANLPRKAEQKLQQLLVWNPGNRAAVMLLEKLSKGNF